MSDVSHAMSRIGYRDIAWLPVTGQQWAGI